MRKPNLQNINYKNIIGFILGPLLFIWITFFLDLEPGKPAVTYTFGIAILMAIWWITEVVPLAVTALLPVVLFPVFGVMDGRDVSSTYFNSVIFLFIGGFLVALAMQKWDLHKRIAIKILLITGTSPARILLGFMLATSFLSMWISNTATAMMMVPILLSITKKLEEFIATKELNKYTVGLLLGVAYSASIGGIATLVGTPPNLSFARIFQIMFPAAPEISFSAWFIYALPITIIFFIVTWLYLYFIYKPKNSLKALKEVNFRQQYKELGHATYEQKVVGIVFVTLALLWLTRAGLNIGSFNVPGWSSLFSSPSYINDGTVAIALSVILFIIPARNNKSKKIMDWVTASKVPWNIVLLFGGGFALASAFKESGLSMWVGEQLASVGNVHPIIIIAVIAVTMTFLTELTSNTATTEMLLPVLAGMSVSINVNPLLLMLPATISASMAFMLPVATPPNAIVFGSNKITVIQMARTGFMLNVLGVIIITLITYFWGSWVFGIVPNVMPDWAVMGN
ncbi:MAG: SLC13/DASS family transporter [Bacteroidetes bacterium]|nr:SLC13/DASS family transporter [Bacteroidota bacterium]MBL6943990.1 SLC13/DASS family transporter [Bacteroidales bacterium]